MQIYGFVAAAVPDLLHLPQHPIQGRPEVMGHTRHHLFLVGVDRFLVYYLVGDVVQHQQQTRFPVPNAGSYFSVVEMSVLVLSNLVVLPKRTDELLGFSGISQF